MKLTRLFMMAAVAAVALPSMTSCLKDDNKYPDYYSPNAIVTVKPNEDNSAFYIQVDDENTAMVTNFDKSPFGKKEVRAIANITKENVEHDGYDMAIKINWIDSLLTKVPVDMAKADVPGDGSGSEDGSGSDDGVNGDGNAEGGVSGNAVDGSDAGTGNEAVDYGNDGIGILKSFFTLVEDGYLTIHFRTLSGHNTKHWLNLLVNTDPENPYLVEFRQKTEGDTYYGNYRDGFVAFKLKDVLPDTEGKSVKLTVKWKDLDGRDRLEEWFDYCTPEEK